MNYLECDVIVLGGLPLTCQFATYPAEPDVGIFSSGIEDFSLSDRNGRWAEWAEKKMTDADWVAVEEQCWNYLEREY